MSTYDEFSKAYHEHFTRDANARVFLGVDRDLGELPDPSLECARGVVAEARELLGILAGFDQDGLDFDASLDLDLARLSLEREVHGHTCNLNGRSELEQKPSCGLEVGEGIFLLFASDPRPDGDRLNDITLRIESVPDYVESMLARLDTPVGRWVHIDLEQVAEIPRLFETMEGWAREIGWSDVARLTAARVQAEAALASYAERLAALPTTDRFHLDVETARRITTLNGVENSLEEIHRFARDFLEETSAIIEELRGRITAKYRLAPTSSAEEVERFLNERFRVQVKGGDTSRVLARYEEEHSRVVRFIRERNLFPIPEDQDLRILETPPFMKPSIPAGAMMPAPPFREGPRLSLVYLTLSDELMDEHTDLSIAGMMVHEGLPGHHLQLATAALHPSIIRRHADFADQCEGWTTMLEDYMLDQGYMGELTDEARYVAKRDISRIGARVAIDLYFMTGEKSYLDVGVDCDLTSDDPFVSAGNLLQKVTGFVPSRVQSELNWYSTERGYPLSYLTGNRLVWDLKNDVAEAQKGRLEGFELDRDFHRVFLQSGNMPVSFLRRVFEHEGMLPSAGTVTSCHRSPAFRCPEREVRPLPSQFDPRKTTSPEVT